MAFGSSDDYQAQQDIIKELKKQIEDLKAENDRLNRLLIMTDKMVDAYLKAQK